ncbi:uncharacterized protein qrfp [Engraulis encrasicolus]|uniref:uncharacterized protein qrfp n=1 Tax=Engraulis encrasicolus TaxID=184585 RepID=UPI002FD2DB88
MRPLSVPPCSSLLAPALLSVAMLVLLSPPRSDAFPQPISLLASLGDPDWEAALRQLDAPAAVGLPAMLQPYGLTRDLVPEVARLSLGEGVERSWGEQPQVVGVAQRRDLRSEDFGKRLPLGTLPEASMNLLHFQDAGEEEGERRNEALHSIAGGLQAFNREKGGFGFRFGRK